MWALVALLLSVFLGNTATVFAMPDSSRVAMQDSSRQKWWSELKLTADQKLKLKAIREDMQQFRKANFEKMKDLREKSKQELLKALPSKDVLYGFAKQLADQHRTMAEHMADHMLKLKGILTKEQFEKILSKDFFMGMQKDHGGNDGGADKKDRRHDKE